MSTASPGPHTHPVTFARLVTTTRWLVGQPYFHSQTLWVWCVLHSFLKTFLIGFDLGHPTDAEGYWRSNSGLHCCRGGNQPDPMGCHPTRLDRFFIQYILKRRTGLTAVSFDMKFVDPLSPYSHLLQQESGDPEGVSVFRTIALGLCVADPDWLSYVNVLSDLGCNLCMTPSECTNKSILFVPTSQNYY